MFVVEFQQDPHLIIEQSDKAKIPCSHNDRTLTLMLWYCQERDRKTLTLISYGYGSGTPTYESGFSERFEMTRKDLSGELSISNPSLSDSVYHCLLLCSQYTQCYISNHLLTKMLTESCM